MLTSYPLPAAATLRSLYVGQSIRDVPTPAAILDRAVAKRNCDQMLEACEALDLQWRAHVKTHKTLELTQLQVSPSPTNPSKPTPINLIYSTLTEAEFLLPWLLSQSPARKINILYGLPISPSTTPRLTTLSQALPAGSISLLIDHPAQLSSATLLSSQSGKPPCLFIKVDMGGRRAGVVCGTAAFADLAQQTLELHAHGIVKLIGLYSHAGHSYAGDSEADAMHMLGEEIRALATGAEGILATAKERGMSGADVPSLTLSVGASPTALSVRNLLSQKKKEEEEEEDGDSTTGAAAAAAAEAKKLQDLMSSIEKQGLGLEIHAGVYPTLDLQQLAAHSLAVETQSWKDVAFTVLAEVVSLYPGRGEGGTDEALVGLALGREFCKAYPGMAMLTPWNRMTADGKDVAWPVGKKVDEYQGWIVGRFAQEHGIVTWMGDNTKDVVVDQLEVGQKVRLWPNHACITGSHFGWYFVVDSSRAGKEEEIVDVWVRCRGW